MNRKGRNLLVRTMRVQQNLSFEVGERNFDDVYCVWLRLGIQPDDLISYIGLLY